MPDSRSKSREIKGFDTSWFLFLRGEFPPDGRKSLNFSTWDSYPRGFLDGLAVFASLRKTEPRKGHRRAQKDNAKRRFATGRKLRNAERGRAAGIKRNQKEPEGREQNEERLQ